MSVAHMALRTKWKPGDRFLVRHKDSAILVIEKKAGVLCQRTESGRGEDLLALLRDFLGVRGHSTPVLPVHRLDRNVSGLLVYARHPAAQQALIAQFREHSVERRYVAAVRGLIKQDEGTIESRLYVDDPSLRVYSIPADDPRPARDAVSHFRVLERFVGARVTLVEVELETGVRNQIRVQFAEAGHPLLGEIKYRHEEGKQGASRVFLHAAVLGFRHPTTGAPVRFTSELPPDLAHWAESLARGAPQPRKAQPGARSPRSTPRRGQRPRKKR